MHYKTNLLDLQVLSHQEFSEEYWDTCAKEEYWQWTSTPNRCVLVFQASGNFIQCTRVNQHAGPCRHAQLRAEKVKDNTTIFTVFVIYRA